MDIAIDIETRGLDATQYILGCLLTDRAKEAETYHKKEELWGRILQLGEAERKRGHMLNVYGHNIAYDFYGVADLGDRNLVLYSHRPFIAGYRDKEGRDYIKFLDTMSLFRMSLKRAGDLIGEPKLKPPAGMDTGTATPEELEPYCKQDVKVCLALVKTAKQYCIKNGIAVKRLYSINQIAINGLINHLRKTVPEPWLFWNPERGELRRTLRKEEVHAAYRGGRVEAFKTGSYEHVWHYDVNSLYPYAASIMRFPALSSERKEWRPLERTSVRGQLRKLGISRAIVTNDSNTLGLLPIRTPSGSYVPKAGTILIGTWTHTELHYAIRHGYTVHNIAWTVTWDDAYVNPFSGYMELLYERRQHATGYEGYFLKMLMNAALGKFAQTRAEQEYVVDSVEQAEAYLKKNYDIMQGIGLNYLYRVEIPSKTKKYYAPILPTMVNAQARVLMHQDMAMLPQEKLLYIDTDSIVIEGNHDKQLTIGEDLGDYKVEHADEACRIYGKKTWLIGDQIKIAGTTKRDVTKADFLAGAVADKKMITLRNKGEGTPGQFTLERRDLTQQEANHSEIARKYAGQRMFVDADIEDISFFLDDIETISERFI